MNTQLKIGHKMFDIIYLDQAQMVDVLTDLGVACEQTDKLGFIDHYFQKIYVRHDVAADTVRETLLHEILHALASDSGMESLAGGRIDNPIEAVVSMMAPRLMQFNQDNPDFFRYLN